MNDLGFDIFDNDFKENIDAEPIIDIDLESIDKDAISDATMLVENLSKLYCNEEFMAANPSFKKRVDSDLESLRILIKMRKADEVAHDNLLKAIAGNSSNASLYRSLTEMQKTIISITTKMGEIVTGLNNLLKGFQLELNFQEDNSEVDSEITSSKDTHRGSKEFIEQMKRESEMSLFEEETEEEP